jgi:hypothetical protein
MSYKGFKWTFKHSTHRQNGTTVTPSQHIKSLPPKG